MAAPMLGHAKKYFQYLHLFKRVPCIYTVNSRSYVKLSLPLCCSENSNKKGKPSEAGKKLDLAKPQDRRRKTEPKNTTTPTNKISQSFQEVLEGAAKDVAEKMGGDVEKTSSDLLDHLRSHKQKSEAKRDGTLKVDGTPSSKKIDMFAGMQFDKRSPNSQMFAKSKDQGRSRDRPSRSRDEKSRPPLLQGNRLNLFETSDIENAKKVTPTNSVFDAIDKSEFEKIASMPPMNAFEEMIQWTKQGKLWNFPIDNEQGMDEERQVGFHEHIFLDHLISDFPKRGPLRHFMELITTGLSKNPYITVQEKREHIEWFREYFKDKMHLLEISEVKQLSESGKENSIAAEK